MIKVIAKVPQAGRCKTRLIPLLGANHAAELCAAMTADVFAIVASLEIPWSIALDGDPEHPWVRQLPVPWEPQAEGELGARLERALAGGGLAVGTDAPSMPARLLRAALESAAEVVFAPAFDGGYTLVRVGDPTGLFQDIPWSSSTTLLASVNRARFLGKSVELLEFWYDVDCPADLHFFQQQLKLTGPEVAPHSRSLIQHWEARGLLPPLPTGL